VEIPEIRYARTPEGVSIAYQVVGDGSSDLLFVPGFASNLIWNWQLPSYAQLLRRLSSFCRLIVVDRRGSGISDRLSPEDLPSLEVIADDLGVVLDAVGSKRASIFAADEGAQGVVLFAATHPERVERLILYAFDPMGDFQPWDDGWKSREEREALLEAFTAEVIKGWGTKEFALSDPLAGLGVCGPSLAVDPSAVDWYTALLLLHSSPSGVVAFHRMYFGNDTQPILASVRVPTLLLHRVGDLLEPIDASRFMAGSIPGARLIELEGNDHVWFAGDIDSIVDPIQEFMTGARPTHDLDRVLATVLFTDIVGSTEHLSAVGDAEWSSTLASHDERARAEIERHRGRFVYSSGDGLLAMFDGPARAVRCAQAIGEAVRPLGFEIRSGCHTGEIELAGENIRGIAVHIGARVASLAGASEILVSSTVKDLVAGSGLTFEDAGEHELKGVPEPWHLYRVVLNA
jgi:class 3 adenylate cyclase